MDVQEFKKIMSQEVGNATTWVGNYFYGNGKYTMEGSPFSTLDDSYKEKNYSYSNWLEWCDCKEVVTVHEMLCVAVGMGYLTTNKKRSKDASLDNAMCGRSNYI